MHDAIRWLVLMGAFAGCATTAGSRPNDMSVTQHREAAAAEATLSQLHQDQLAVSPPPPSSACEGNAIDPFTGLSDPCWTSLTNPTEIHRRDAEEHRRRAADHRAAAAALIDAEKSACSGISADDRDISPFEHVEDIASVEALPNTGRGTSGARVTFRAVPGLTAARLKRLVVCHLARNAAIGNVVPEMPNCPLVPRGIEATVGLNKDSLEVVIWSADPMIGAEILARAKRLSSVR